MKVKDLELQKCKIEMSKGQKEICKVYFLRNIVDMLMSCFH